MRRIAAMTALLAASTIALAQARYEMGIQFNDEDEIVRVAAEPFHMSGDSDRSLESRFLQRTHAFNFFGDGEPTLSAINLHIRAPRFSDERLFSRARTVATFDDLVFTARESEVIEVGMHFMFPGFVFVVPSGPEYAGVRYTAELTIRINGQAFTGSSSVLLTGDRDQFVVDFSGILLHRASGMVSVPSIEVPTNKPLVLSIEIAKWVYRPQGSTAAEMQMRFREPESGFPTGGDIFTLPDGVRVDSAQARIHNNRWLVCPTDINQDGSVDLLDFLAFQNLFDAGDIAADFDLDGTLTIFDFLAFQNAFDAGCP